MAGAPGDLLEGLTNQRDLDAPEGKLRGCRARRERPTCTAADRVAFTANRSELDEPERQQERAPATHAVVLPTQNPESATASQPRANLSDPSPVAA